MNQVISPLTPRTIEFNNFLKSLFKGESKLKGIRIIKIPVNLKCDYCDEDCITTKRLDKTSVELLQYHSRGGVISYLCDNCSKKINESYKMKITYVNTCFFCNTSGVEVNSYLMNTTMMHSYVDVCDKCIKQVNTPVEGL